MENERSLDIRESVRVVTHNDFITACGLEDISLKARKLLYVAIAQCKKTDTEFYEYSLSTKQFAEMMGISASHVYEEADAITDELMRGFIRVDTGKKSKKGTRSFKKYNLFCKCEYTEKSLIYFKINKDMTDFLLEVKGNFTQPLLEDFLKMNSPYSMEIWHLMQREMHSKKASGTDVIEFDLTLEELRQVTGTQEKLNQLVEFKRRVLDKAIREIKDNCNVLIAYENIKTGRTVTGFHFITTSSNYIAPEKRSMELENRLEHAEQTRRSKRGVS